MKHLVLCEYGSSLGTTGERVVVKQHGELLAEYPLAQLHSITIAKQGNTSSLTKSIESRCLS